MGIDREGNELGKYLSQKSNGKYMGRFMNKFGKRQSVWGSDLEEVERRLKEAIKEDKNLDGSNSNITLTEWFPIWLDVHKYSLLRPSTRMNYITIFRKHIEPKLGKKKLKEINRLSLLLLLKELDKQGYKYETKNAVKVMLSDMLDKALISDMIPKNPCKGVKVARDERKEMRVLTVEEQSTFFECCRGTFYDNLFIIAVTTGLRQGELCALTWDDVNLEKKELRVNKTLLYQKLENDKGKTFHVGPPKTEMSNRIIPIGKQCEIALKKQFIQRNAVAANELADPIEGFENLLFISKFARPMCDQSIIDAIDRIIKEINRCRDRLEQFEHFSPHCFRHTFATRCFESEIQPKIVQQLLGHATLKMTMDLYTHVLDNKKAESIEKLDITLEGIYNGSEEIAEDRYVDEIKRRNKVVDFKSN